MFHLDAHARSRLSLIFVTSRSQSRTLASSFMRRCISLGVGILLLYATPIPAQRNIYDNTPNARAMLNGGDTVKGYQLTPDGKTILKRIYLRTMFFCGFQPCDGRPSQNSWECFNTGRTWKLSSTGWCMAIRPAHVNTTSKYFTVKQAVRPSWSRICPFLVDPDRTFAFFSHQIQGRLRLYSSTSWAQLPGARPTSSRRIVAQPISCSPRTTMSLPISTVTAFTS
jgi:hypothetical protein